MQGGSKRSVSMQSGSKAADIVETILKHAPGRLDEVENQRVVDLVLNAYLSNLTSAANVTFVGQDVTGAKRVLHVCASVSVLLYRYKVKSTEYERRYPGLPDGGEGAGEDHFAKRDPGCSR